MRLIGSRTEVEYRKNLMSSHELYFVKESRLTLVLESQGYPTENVYLLDWIPDQRECFYSVLIEGVYLLSTEIDRCEFSAALAVERSEIEGYLKGLSRSRQVQLSVAMHLAQTKNNRVHKFALALLSDFCRTV